MIQICTTCHPNDGYSESVHGQSVMAGNPDNPDCSDCHGLHKIPILKGDKPKAVQFRKEFHTEVCQKCHGDKKMMERNKVFLIATQTYYHRWFYHAGYRACLHLSDWLGILGMKQAMGYRY